MARPVLRRAGAAEGAVSRIAHLDRDRPLVEAAQRDPARFDALTGALLVEDLHGTGLGRERSVLAGEIVHLRLPSAGAA